MKQLVTKLKPVDGFAHTLHLVLTVALPILLYIFIRIDLVQLALATVVISKWRMFAVRPRYWLANIQANSADILVGISTIIFMMQTSSQAWQLVWAGVYAVWLLLLKPGNSLLSVAIQGLLAELVGLMSVYIAWGSASSYILVITTWVVCYVAARHFFTGFEEPYTKFLSDVWAFFGASLAWVSGHWLLYYGIVAQPVLFLVVISFGLATIYYLNHNDRLTNLIKRQLVFMMTAVIIVVLVFSDWGDKTL